MLLQLAPVRLPGNPYLYAAAGAAAVVAAVVVGVFLWRWLTPRPRTLREKVGRTIEGYKSEDVEELLWLPKSVGADDRRTAQRRGGPTTPIRIATAPDAEPGRTEEGLVLDRAKRGLCFAAHGAYPVGATVFVRAVAAPKGSPWVAATVRNCRGRDDHYLIGCEFHDSLTWDVLLLFG